MSTKIFQSNETLEACDVKVSQDGRIEINTRGWNNAALERLGKPEKAIRGRVTQVEQNFIFAPYAEGSRKPTYKKQLVVGSTTLQCTEDMIKISFLVPRHLRKDIMVMYIQSEIDEVKRRLDSDVYDSLVKETHSNPPCEGGNSYIAEPQVLPHREDLGGSQEGGAA